MTAQELIDSAWGEGLTPPPLSLVSEWADQNRILGGGASEPGLYRSSRTPYAIEIMDTLSPSSPAREVDVMKGSQLGLTETTFNWIGFVMSTVPQNILCVLPDQATAKEWSQQRLSQLVEETQCLSGKIANARTRDGGNSTFSKRFGGCHLKMAWASSAKKMRSTPAAYIVADEVDGFVRDASGEGSPIALLRRRFANFPDGKFYRVSTPTDRQTSLIEQGFLEGDQRYYFVPCPYCAHYQVIQFSQLKWERGDYESVRYVCMACDERIHERFKTQMLARGRWIAVKGKPDLLKSGVSEEHLPELAPIFGAMKVATHASFHLSALYSPLGWYSWSTTAQDWEKAQRDTKSLKTYINTVLGESWVERGAAPEWELLYERAGTHAAGQVPHGAIFVTAGIDVQANRLECEIVGWGRHFHSWSIDYHVIQGDPNNDETWKQLEQYLRTEIPHENGTKLKIWAVGIDTGYSAKIVYRFSERFPRAIHGHGRSYIKQPLTLVPTKGGYSPVKLIEGISGEDAARKRRGLKIVTIGTHTAKQELYDWLRSRPLVSADGEEQYPTGYCFFPKYEPSYFQGLCSESRVVRDSGKVEWVKDPNVRNEPLDTRVIARAMAALFGLDRFSEKQWDALEQMIQPVTETPLPPVHVTAQPVGAAPMPMPQPQLSPAPMPSQAPRPVAQPYQRIRSNWMNR